MAYEDHLTAEEQRLVNKAFVVARRIVSDCPNLGSTARRVIDVAGRRHGAASDRGGAGVAIPRGAGSKAGALMATAITKPVGAGSSDPSIGGVDFRALEPLCVARKV
jgi:hypothetical protein